jgi:hypothetical protein
LLGLGLLSGALPRSAAGWTPQTDATIALICYCIGLVLALLAFLQSRRGQSLDGVTKFLSLSLSLSLSARARDHRSANLFPSGHDRIVGESDQAQLREFPSAGRLE